MDPKLKEALDVLADQRGETLNDAATLMLLRVIELNGGRIHRGALAKAIDKLHDQGLIKEKFNPPTPKNYTNYDFLLTEDGHKRLDNVKAQAVKSLEVEVVKKKNGRPTVIKYKGNRYAWERPGKPVNYHKNKGVPHGKDSTLPQQK